MSNIQDGTDLYQQITDICFEKGQVSKPMVDALAALVARREALLIEKLQNWGSWMTDHCDNHQKYTSACCGCQRASHALHTIESYKDWQTRELAALTTEATQSGKGEDNNVV